LQLSLEQIILYASKNCLIASSVQGILAASVTHITPFAINFFASSSFNSFCVAHGIAISTLASQGLFPL
jgi:hypothetical protein